MEKDRRLGATRARAFLRILSETQRELVIILIQESPLMDLNKLLLCLSHIAMARPRTVLPLLTHLCIVVTQDEARGGISALEEECTAAQKLHRITHHLRLVIQ